MDEQTYSTHPGSPSDADLSPRWALERSELQSEVDALVHQVLGGLLKAAEDLKQRIREETTLELAEGHRQLNQLQEDIATAQQELADVRAAQQTAAVEAIEQEREAILSAARQDAERIIRDAEAEREHMLSEIRATEDRLRGLQEQIQALLGFSGTSAAPVAPAPPPPPPAPEPVAPPLESPGAPASPPVESIVAGEAGTAPVAEEPREPMEAAPVAEPEPAAPTGPRPIQLVFANVPGYQQAAAIERSTRQLPDVGNVEVLEFERGRLVLQIDAADPAGLAAQVVANAPAAMTLTEEEPDSLTFQLS